MGISYCAKFCNFKNMLRGKRTRMRRQIFTIILGDRGQHIGKRYFCFRFTFLTKKNVILYLYHIFKRGFRVFRIKHYFLSQKMLILAPIAASCSNSCYIHLLYS